MKESFEEWLQRVEKERTDLTAHCVPHHISTLPVCNCTRDRVPAKTRRGWTVDQEFVISRKVGAGGLITGWVHDSKECGAKIADSSQNGRKCYEQMFGTKSPRPVMWPPVRPYSSFSH